MNHNKGVEKNRNNLFCKVWWTYVGRFFTQGSCGRSSGLDGIPGMSWSSSLKWRSIIIESTNASKLSGSMFFARWSADSRRLWWLRPLPNGPCAAFERTELKRRVCCIPALRTEFFTSFQRLCVDSGCMSKRSPWWHRVYIILNGSPSWSAASVIKVKGGSLFTGLSLFTLTLPPSWYLTTISSYSSDSLHQPILKIFI